MKNVPMDDQNSRLARERARGGFAIVDAKVAETGGHMLGVSSRWAGIRPWAVLDGAVIFLHVTHRSPRSRLLPEHRQPIAHPGAPRGGDFHRARSAAPRGPLGDVNQRPALAVCLERERTVSSLRLPPAAGRALFRRSPANRQRRGARCTLLVRAEALRPPTGGFSGSCRCSSCRAGWVYFKTEILHAFYFSYYFILIGGVTIAWFGPKGTTRQPGPGFETAITSMRLAFFFSFMWFPWLPARGPWENPELMAGLPAFQGIVFTPIIEWIIERGAVSRGCFPSSHVAGSWGMVLGLAGLPSTGPHSFSDSSRSE